MDSLSYWLVFLSAALAINILLGPDLIFVLSRTFAEGRRVGFASLLGVWTGALVHMSAAALGLSAILAFLPQGVRSELGHVPAQIMLLGVLVIAVAVVVELSAMLLAARLTRTLRGNARIAAWPQRILGSVLIALGVRVALIGHRTV